MARFYKQFDGWAHVCALILVMVLGLTTLGSFLSGCQTGEVSDSERIDSVVSCTVDTLRYPTTQVDFGHLYSGRGFLVPSTSGAHLGRDIALVEGTAIHPIGCGTVQIYRAATGYGTLAVVIEHRLARPVMLRNGAGELVVVQDFLSIYGHLRSTSLVSGGTSQSWRVGDRIDPERVLGYVQNDALNGDGEEHLHLGIRLQSLADAQRADVNWFRGYDTSPSQRRWFVDPQVFFTALAAQGVAVTWHPPGTVIARASRPTDRWVVTDEQTLRAVDSATLTLDRLNDRVIPVSDDEIGCYRMDTPYLSERRGFHVMRFSDTPAVYEYTDTPRSQRFTFISQEAFLSWGWRNEEVEFRPASRRADFLSRYADQGMRRLRDGSLVKGHGASEVSVVSHGARLPIADWSIFLGLGYREDSIFEIDPSTLDAVAFPRGAVITLERARTCLFHDCTLGDSCDPPSPSMDAAVTTMIDASIDVGSGEGHEVAVEEPLPGGVHDAGVAMDVTPDVVRTTSPPEDAGVRTGMDAGLIMGGGDAAVISSHDASTCDDPPPPVVASVMDAGVGSVRDASVMDVVSMTSDVVTPPPAPPPSGIGVRYEFRVVRDSDGWAPTTPYYLRDHWWRIQPCLNVRASSSDPAGSRLESVGDGWYRCDVATALSPFVGTFFSPSHPESGDRGHIATVDNWPERCTPRNNVEWRITDLASGRSLYTGPASGLPCVADGANDRHGLP